MGLFARQGFAGTSVRQVCELAGANVAAVNYHFGSKRGLYDAVLDEARAVSNARNPWVELDTDRDFWSGEDPETRLRRFVSMMLTHALDEHGNASDLSRLMIHELLDPTGAFERQVEVSIARVYTELSSICADIAGRDPGDADIARVALMINAQCQYPAVTASMVSAVYPGLTFDQDGRDALAALISGSVIATLRSLGET